jgi:hypothetical protein
MPRPWIAFILVSLLAACAPYRPAADTQAADASQTAASAPVNTGCLGKDILTCVAMLRPVETTFGSGQEIERQLAYNSAVDVNGRSLDRSRVLQLTAKMAEGQFNDIYVDYDGTNIVTAILIELSRDPIAAQTTDEYDATAIMPTAMLICGTACGDMSKDELYRFFQNQVKSRIHVARFARDRLQVRTFASFDSIDYAIWSERNLLRGYHWQYAFELLHQQSKITTRNKTGILRAFPSIILTQ